MANATAKAPSCPLPFLAESDFPATGGHISGRACQSLAVNGGISCCLPCPQTAWVYDDAFESTIVSADYVAIASFVLCAFLLLSYMVLPPEKTRRNFISVSVVISAMLLQLAFIVPLGTNPQLCHNAITPNDMYTDLSCGVTGVLLLGGAWAVAMWVFLRALHIHLHVCWRMHTGRRFVILGSIAGWGVPAVITAETLAISGVSYRFGTTCHSNHGESLWGFWVPVLVVSGMTVVLHFYTIGYCVRAFVAARIEGGAFHRGLLLSSQGSSTTSSARETYYRVREIVRMQWRGFIMVFILLANAVYITVSYLVLDRQSETVEADPVKELPWALCLVVHNGDKNKCLDLARQMVLSQSCALALLFCLSVTGFYCFAVLIYSDFFVAWADLHRRHLTPAKAKDRGHGPGSLPFSAMRPGHGQVPTGSLDMELYSNDLMATTPGTKHDGRSMTLPYRKVDEGWGGGPNAFSASSGEEHDVLGWGQRDASSTRSLAPHLTPASPSTVSTIHGGTIPTPMSPV